MLRQENIADWLEHPVRKRNYLKEKQAQTGRRTTKSVKRRGG